VRLPCGAWALAAGACKAAHVENLLLLDGRAAGVALAQFGIAALLRAAPENLPRLAEVHLDRAALLFAWRSGVSSVVSDWRRRGSFAHRSHRSLEAGGSRGVVGRGSHTCGTR